MCTAYVHSLCCFCFMDPAFSKVGEISTFNFAGLGTQANLSTDFMKFIFHSDRMRPRLHSKCIWHAGDPAKMLALGLWHSHIRVSGCFWKITGGCCCWPQLSPWQPRWSLQYSSAVWGHLHLHVWWRPHVNLEHSCSSPQKMDLFKYLRRAGSAKMWTRTRTSSIWHTDFCFALH